MARIPTEELFATKAEQLYFAEGQQVRVRLLVTAILLTFISIANFSIVRFDRLTSNDVICQILMVCSCLFAIGMAVHQSFVQRFVHNRVVVGLIHDVLVTTLFLMFSRYKVIPLLFIYPWITIGHGFRFGESYLFVASLFTSFAMLMLFKLSSYWGTMAPNGFDIGMIFVLIASYTGYLLRDLQSVKEVLKALATRDPLTGLANRRIIEDQLPALIDRNRKEKQALGLIYLDLDGFKPVNDKLGHDSGDHLLQQIALALRKSVRKGDIVARVGGDEFLVVVQNVNNETDLATRGREIRKTIESIQFLNGASIDISASVGCLFVGSGTPQEWRCSARLLREADRLMYNAKQSGRGMLSLAKTDEIAVPRVA